TVTAPGGFSDTNSADNSSTDSDSLAPQGDLSITKTDGTSTAVPGGTDSYTIVVSNSGPSTAVGATVSDALGGVGSGESRTRTASSGVSGNTTSGGGSIHDTVTLPSGGTITYTVTGTIAAGATGNLVNTATVTAPGGFSDTNSADNSSTDSDSLAPQGDLSITKTDGTSTAVPGGTDSYTIVVSNSGPSTAVGATVSDALG